MRIYDITQTISDDMTVWPGDPAVRLIWLSQISRGGVVNLTEIRMSAHTGTHIDMPAHFIDQGKSLDELDLNVMIGPVKVVEIPQNIRVIDESFLKDLSLAGVSRVLFKTANSVSAQNTAPRFHEDYVALDESGATFLSRSGCKLVGIDYLSIATFDDPKGAHLPLLEAGIVVLEGLDLRDIKMGTYQLIALPMKLSGREGAPVRAILIESRDN